MSPDTKKVRKSRSNIVFRGYIRTLVALRLRAIEHEYETFDKFVKATGFSASLVFRMLRGQQNLTSDTLDTLAFNLRIPIWELLNAPGIPHHGELVPNTSVDHMEIYRAVYSGRELDLEKFRGGHRKDWQAVRAKRMRGLKADNDDVGANATKPRARKVKKARRK